MHLVILMNKNAFDFIAMFMLIYANVIQLYNANVLKLNSCNTLCLTGNKYTVLLIHQYYYTLQYIYI